MIEISTQITDKMDKKDSEEIDYIIESLGMISKEVWLSPLPGKILGELYFKGNATQDELKERLNCSLSAISQGLALLQILGKIKVAKKEGRKSMYTTCLDNTNIQKNQIRSIIRIKTELFDDALAQGEAKIKDKDAVNKIRELRKLNKKSALALKGMIDIFEREE